MQIVARPIFCDQLLLSHEIFTLTNFRLTLWRQKKAIAKVDRATKSTFSRARTLKHTILKRPSEPPFSIMFLTNQNRVKLHLTTNILTGKLTKWWLWHCCHAEPPHGVGQGTCPGAGRDGQAFAGGCGNCSATIK